MPPSPVHRWGRGGGLPSYIAQSDSTTSWPPGSRKALLPATSQAFATRQDGGTSSASSSPRPLDEVESDLHARWFAVVHALAGSSTLPNSHENLAQRWWGVISGNYQRPHRGYHSLRHLDALFTGVSDELGPASKSAVDRLRHDDAFAGAFSGNKSSTNRMSLALAIFFHDIVYEPAAPYGKNEEDSAVLFLQFWEEALKESLYVRGILSPILSLVVPASHKGDKFIQNPAGICVGSSVAGSFVGGWV